MTDTYFQKDGKTCIYISADAGLAYGLDLTNWLAGGTLSSVSATAVGVTADPAYIDGNKVLARVRGIDTSDGARNSLTFHFNSSLGPDSRTLHFLLRR